MHTTPRDDILAALRACHLWHGASDDGIFRLAQAARPQEAPRGTILATEGDLADRFGVVVVGKLRVYHMQPGGRSITLETVEASGVIAGVAALAGGRYPAYVDAATPSIIAWLPRDSVFELMAVEPQVCRSIIADLAQRVINLTTVVQTLALDVPARLAGYLFQRALKVGEPVPEGLRVTLGMTKTELAASLGTVPETLSRAFARLRHDEILDVRAHDVIVYDVGALARLSGGYEE